jgi:hypothetical protein
VLWKVTRTTRVVNTIPRSFKVKLSAFNGKKSERYRPGEQKKFRLITEYQKKSIIFVKQKPQWRNGSVIVLQTIGGGSNPSWGTNNEGVSAGS